MKRSFFILLISAILGGCGGDDPTVERRPDNGGDRVDRPSDTPDEPSDNPTDDPETPDPTLDNRAMRFESPRLTLEYETPGTLFSVSTDRRVISARSLTTGDAVTITLPTSPERVATGQTAEIDINGTASPATVSATGSPMSENDNSSAIRFTTDGGRCYLVVNGL